MVYRKIAILVHGYTLGPVDAMVASSIAPSYFNSSVDQYRTSTLDFSHAGGQGVCRAKCHGIAISLSYESVSPSCFAVAMPWAAIVCHASWQGSWQCQGGLRKCRVMPLPQYDTHLSFPSIIVSTACRAHTSP